MLRVTFLLLAALLLAGTAAAQGLPGYVLTTTGDTLPGTLLEKSRQRLLLYPADNSQPRQFRAAQVRGYGLRGHTPIFSRVVRLATGADSVRFVLLQQPGAASLYSNGNETGLLLGVASTDTLYELSEANWHVVLNRHLRACPTLDHGSPEMLQLPYSEENIRNVLARYNVCTDPQWQPASRSSRLPWQEAVGLRVGVLPLFSTNDENLQARQQGWGKLVGLDYVRSRASGLQYVFRLDYYALRTLESTLFPAFFSQSKQIEQQTDARGHFVAASVGVSKRFRHTPWVSSCVGFGFGPDYLVHASTTIRQREAGTGAPFAVTDTRRDPGGLAGHADANAGVIFRVQGSHEVSLTAFYRYLPTAFSIGGVQVSYLLYLP